MLLEMLQAIQGLGDCRDVSERDPPQDEDGALDRFEPLLPIAKWPNVCAPVDELLERFEGFPHGHVDGHALVGERSDRHGIAVFGLESPHEPWTAVGQRIDGVQLGAEALHDRIFERRSNSPDVRLRQMETSHSLLLTRSLLNDLVRPRQHRLGDGKVKELGGLEVDDEVEPVELLNRQISRVGAQENALDLLGRESADGVGAHAVARQGSLGYASGVLEHGRQPLRPRRLNDQLHLATDHRVRHVEKGIGLPGAERAQTRPQLVDRGDSTLDEPYLEPARGIARDLDGLLSGGVVGAVERHHPAETWKHLLQKLEALRREVRELAVDARKSPAGLPEGLDKAEGYRISRREEHDGDAFCGPLGRERDRGGHRIDQVDLLRLETPRGSLHRLQIALGIAHVEDELLALLESELPETVSQPIDGGGVRASLEEDSYAINADLRSEERRVGKECR